MTELSLEVKVVLQPAALPVSVPRLVRQPSMRPSLCDRVMARRERKWTVCQAVTPVSLSDFYGTQGVT